MPSVNPDRVDQHEIVAEMQRVDFDRRWSADRSAAMESASRAAHNATNLREANDFENPRSGRCRHLTLGQPDSATEPARRHIDQRQAHRPSDRAGLPALPVPARDRHLGAVHMPDPRALASILPPWKPICPRVRPERFARRAASRPRRRAQAAVTSASIIVPSASSLPQGRTGRSSPALLRRLRPQASVAGEPAGVISPVLALLSFVESARRAYRLKVGNADLFRKSTEHGTTSRRAIQNSQESPRALCAMPRKWGRTSLAKISISGPMAWSSA